jgi:diadenosine tetraphosphate (Ap4A) HIT family hydrolase
MTCIICDKKFENNILFENDKIIIMLAVEPSVNGHIQIFSKEHYTIMEQTPDEIVSFMVAAANKISMVLFEVLKVHGTNIIINNGVSAGQKIPHLSVYILPRRTDDNLKLDWTLKQATPEALDSIHKIIEEGMNKPETKVIEEVPEPEDPTQEVKRKDDSNDNDSEEEYEKKTNFYHQIFEKIP